MLGCVVENGMHPVNEIGGICRARSFSIILWRALYIINGRTKIYEEDAYVVACLL